MTKSKPKKPRIVGRTDIGIAVYGGTTYPLGAHLIYRLDWSDGTSTTARGLTVGTMPGQAYSVRPDLQSHMAAISALIPPIREACWALDVPPKRPRKKKPPQGGYPRQHRRR